MSSFFALTRKWNLIVEIWIFHTFKQHTYFYNVRAREKNWLLNISQPTLLGHQFTCSPHKLRVENYTWRFLDVWFWVKSHWRLTKWRPLQSCGSLHRVESISGVVVRPRGREGLLHRGKSLKLMGSMIISKRSFWVF